MLDTERILSDLNDAQREAVTWGDGPLLILAGAGSGKTRVITHRIAWLVGHHGVDPRGLVAMTFTNKAAGEMKQRAEALLGLDLAGAYVGTFHAFGLRILRAHAVAAGYPPTFVVYDTADQQAIVRAALKERGLASQELPPRRVLTWISRNKTALVAPEDAAAEARGPEQRLLAELYAEYETRLRRAGAVDFDDLLVQVVRLFLARPEIAERYRERIRHLLVDEYQDTNPLQYRLIRLLAERHRNICAVGDEDQSIYAFRGADIRNILDFTRDYPDAHLVKLEQNYRSTGNILAVASGVIRHNTGRYDKTLWTDASDGPRVVVRENRADRDEADWVVGEMLRLARRGDVALEQCAVLYRTNATSRLFEDRLMAHNVPYRVVGALRFWERREVKDLLAWLRMLVHPDSDQDLLRAATTPPRGIGQKTLERVAELAAARGCSLHEAARALAGQPEGLGTRALRALDGFLGTVRDLTDLAATTSTAGTLEAVLEAIDYFAYLERAFPGDHDSRTENVGALVDAAREHDEAGAPDGLAGFLDRVSLRSDTDDVQGERGPSLMTIHAAKGLEFDAVFIVGMNEDLFPHPWSVSDPEGLEEERRLLYVAITRARRLLSLTFSRFRSQFGQVVHARPSRFLDELPPDRIRRSGGAADAGRHVHDGPPARTATPAAGTARTAGRLAYEPEPAQAGAEWFPGMHVEHPTFGPGIVMTVDGPPHDPRLKIRFRNGRLRRIAVRHATLMRGTT
ncbi:MAG: DNA helicase PcrA [Acidobacteriota bacterium]